MRNTVFAYLNKGSVFVFPEDIIPYPYANPSVNITFKCNKKRVPLWQKLTSNHAAQLTFPYNRKPTVLKLVHGYEEVIFVSKRDFGDLIQLDKYNSHKPFIPHRVNRKKRNKRNDHFGSHSETIVISKTRAITL